MGAYEKHKEKRNRKRRFRKILSSVFFSFIFILWGFYYILESDLMNLQLIVIEGNSYVQDEEIIQLSSLIYNRNILKYNLKMVKEKVQSHPYIKEAQVKRKIPRTIVIEVKERGEYAIIPYMGSYIYIDQENVVLKADDSYLADDLLLITGVDIKSFKVGELVDAVNSEELRAALNILKAAKLTSVFDMVSEINISEQNNIRLITIDGVEIMLGEGNNPAYLMLALDEILINLYTQNIRDVVIDMRYEGHISVRERNKREEQ